MCYFHVKDRYSLEDVILLVKLLRDKEHGCPWDMKQTHESVRQNFIEEVYEAVEAIDRDDPDILAEELGDVLLQVALHAEIANEAGHFDIDDIADVLCKKLVLRHPHIFADIPATSADEVLSNWEDIKRDEKAQSSGTDAIEDIPKSMPVLMRSQKVQKRAAYVGFDYPDVNMAADDLKTEVKELVQALSNDGNVLEEIGDVIFSAVNVARLSGLDAELAAERACKKFIERFRVTEELSVQQGIDMKNCGIDKLNELWSKAKRALKDAE